MDKGHEQEQCLLQRQLRAGELIRHALADIFLRGETGDPELERLTPTVVEVQMSPDLKIATAFVRTLIQQGREQQLLEALNRNKKYIRGLVAPKLEMKFTPEIRYRIDTALDYAQQDRRSAQSGSGRGISRKRNDEWRVIRRKPKLKIRGGPGARLSKRKIASMAGWCSTSPRA